MKIVYIPRILILSVLIMVLPQVGFSQQSAEADEFNPTDSLYRGKLLSTYREFFKWKEYDAAIGILVDHI